MSETVLECKDIFKEYAQGHLKVAVLKGLSLKVEPGQHIAIVGMSGSGKSTLLNILGGLDQPNEGSVTINGKAFSQLSDNERGAVRNSNLGFVYQFHHLLGEFTALENVSMPLLIGGKSKKSAEEQAKNLLERVGLEHRIEHKPSELSGGERQRVAIARALANNPSCVLMDEPTGNLDGNSARSVQELMTQLSDTLSTAFVVVTHDPQFANQMDAVYELREGSLALLEQAS